MLLLLWSNYPPGADIGLHNSVIHSITGSGYTNFMHNSYQMGGGTSLTFPGYHIFASSIILMTGLPDVTAHVVIVALFSSLIALSAFLITKSIWSESAGYIVAFLVAISRFDIEMTIWGGYPNVITLLLIPLTFYLYLQKDRFSLTPFLVSTSILAGSIFLTHSLSAAIFVGVTFITVLFVFIYPKKFGASRKTGLYWLLPIILGAILVLPFLLNAVPTYLADNSSAPGVQGVSDITSAILTTRILPLEFVFPLFLIILAFILFSKAHKGRFVSLPTLLLSTWLAVPLVLTQGYLFGFIIDYNRFLYFIILPIMIFIALLIDHASGFFAKVIDFYRAWTSQNQKSKKIPDKKILIDNGLGFSARIHRSWTNRVEKNKEVTRKKIVWLSAHLTHKAVYGVFVLFFLLFSFVFIPVFMTPYQNVGQSIQSFYQVMDNPGWEAIQWAKQNTPTNSVFVSDALYGWWFGGFAQRPTLSAVDPQYLTSAREVAPAKNATYLLDTDYLVDNGLVQVRDDGGYIARHNPEILATLNWTYFPYSFFTFGSDQIHVDYHVINSVYNFSDSVYLNNMTIKDMGMDIMRAGDNLANDTQYARITVTRGNDFFNLTQTTTVYKDLRFVNMTTTINSTVPGVAIDWVYMNVQSEGTQIPYDDYVSVGMIDEGVKAFGQVVFNTKPFFAHVWSGSPSIIELHYKLDGKSQGVIQMSASAYSVTDNLQFYKDASALNKFFVPIIASNLNPTQNSIETQFKQTFEYRAEIQNHSVSYIACRVPEMYPKFLNDPAFSLVFINSEVAIFKVNGNLNQNG
jgi:hypothetical protein